LHRDEWNRVAGIATRLYLKHAGWRLIGEKNTNGLEKENGTRWNGKRFCADVEKTIKGGVNCLLAATPAKKI
jgi:hypothetical protein